MATPSEGDSGAGADTGIDATPMDAAPDGTLISPDGALDGSSEDAAAGDACPDGECSWQSVGMFGGGGCGLKVGGAAYCWGLNANPAPNPGNQFPGLSGSSPSLPTRIAGSSTFSQVRVGGFGGCALDSQGVVATCWGYASEWYDGVPSTYTNIVSNTFQTLSVGRDQVCGIDTTGTAYCWGTNQIAETDSEGALGGGSDAGTLAYAQVLGGPYAAIAVGQDNACALDRAGAAYCWGNGEEGQLGNGTLPEAGAPTSPLSPPPTPVSALAPTPVSGGLTFATISVGAFNVCGVTTSGVGYCWGSQEGYGALGTGDYVNHGVPTAVQMPAGVLLADIEDGTFTSCALTTTGAVYCWGDNRGGALGQGTETPTNDAGAEITNDAGIPISDTSVPALVPGLPPISSLSVNMGVCALTAAGARYCWGSNDWEGASILGDGTTVNRPSPEQVP